MPKASVEIKESHKNRKIRVFWRTFFLSVFIFNLWWECLPLLFNKIPALKTDFFGHVILTPIDGHEDGALLKVLILRARSKKMDSNPIGLFLLLDKASHGTKSEYFLPYQPRGCTLLKFVRKKNQESLRPYHGENTGSRPITEVITECYGITLSGLAPGEEAIMLIGNIHTGETFEEIRQDTKVNPDKVYTINFR